jgi:hypothetical protein
VARSWIGFGEKLNAHADNFFQAKNRGIAVYDRSDAVECNNSGFAGDIYQ